MGTKCDFEHGDMKRVLTASMQCINTDINLNHTRHLGTAVAQWLRFCATNRKVAGSIPDGVACVRAVVVGLSTVGKPR